MSNRNEEFVVTEDINGVVKPIRNGNDFFCDDFQIHHIFNPPEGAKNHAKKTFTKHEHFDLDTDGSFFPEQYNNKPLQVRHPPK